jgi:hypothetical protein
MHTVKRSRVPFRNLKYSFINISNKKNKVFISTILTVLHNFIYAYVVPIRSKVTEWNWVDIF